MAIYIVTGKLGGGKTLGAVSKIDEALAQGRMVATNLDLDLAKLPSVGKKAKRTRVVRLPDKPQVDDIESIGFGIEGVRNLSQARAKYDESKFGLLVLDECGTWLNSRDWAEEGRRELINCLLHIRKHLWDVYLIIQDISMLDKQARKALAEHVVYCRRFDRIRFPGLNFISEHLFGKPLSMPKLHMGIVKYGDQPNSMTVDRWWYNGTSLYSAYDTTQVFSSDYQTGIYCLLPPFYLHSKSLTNWNVRNVMRLTSIVLRKYSQTLLLAAGVVAGSVLAHAFMPSPDPVPEVVEEPLAEPVSGGAFPAMPERVKARPLLERLTFSHQLADGINSDLVFTDGERLFRTAELAFNGIKVNKIGRCKWRLDDSNTQHRKVVTCYD
jgi:hypothetical protein